MQYVDDRTEQQKATHRWAVVAKDRFLSGWGRAWGGASWCGWACETVEDAEKAERWVAGRGDMRLVSIRKIEGNRKIRLARSCVHFHLYVACKGHPALA